MIGWLSARAIGAGIPAGAARVLAWAAFALLLAALLALGLCMHDRALIARHDTGRDVALSEGARAADANAATQRRADDARGASEAATLKEVIAHEAALPEASAAPSAARLAYYACIRMQQAARAAGHPAPAC